MSRTQARSGIRYRGPPPGVLGVLVTLLLIPGAVPLLGGGRSPAWVAARLAPAAAGLGIVMVAAPAAIISSAPPQRAGMASSIESVSYELGGPELIAITTAGMPGTPK
jgi:MFS transporter, DHA2 family, multidrug resistance protein